MQRMAHASSREAALRQVGKERPADALPAAQLARALQQHKVYLLSRLDPSVVEDLDMVPVGRAGRVGPARPAAPIVHPAFQRPVCDNGGMPRWMTNDDDDKSAIVQIVISIRCLTLPHESPRT